MNFADISVKEPQSMVTAVVRLATCAERRAGGCAKVESGRGEMILVRSKHHVLFQGAVFRGGGYQFNSNWTETLSFAAHGLVPLGCERVLTKA